MDVNLSSLPPSSDLNDKTPIRVMVVDDSSVVRGLITRAIEGNPQIQVVASVSDGQMAINTFQRTPVDVIILDIEMPIMDGITALPKLLAIDPAVRIIVASTLSIKNADISLRALSLGAADYIPKPTAREISGALSFKDDLINKIIAYAQAAHKAGVRRPPNEPARAPILDKTTKSSMIPPAAATRRPDANAQLTLRPASFSKPDLIAIGSSTGGPQALFSVIKSLGNIQQPVIITQHMPPSFTTILAEHISRQCGVTCVEARNGMELEGGVYYIAAGDYHLILKPQATRPLITLTQDPPENFCRPAVDPMLRSAVAIYGKKILTIILTGMGQDGWKGCEKIVEAGGAVIAQDEATSVVWGMPAAVARAGLCSAILPLDEIGLYARRVAQGASA
jgi:two-component system chemotaxis response regulator CheB